MAYIPIAQLKRQVGGYIPIAQLRGEEPTISTAGLFDTDLFGTKTTTPATFEGLTPTDLLKAAGQGIARQWAATGAKIVQKIGLDSGDTVDPKTFFGASPNARALGVALFGREEPFNATSEDVEMLEIFGAEPEAVKKFGGSLTLLFSALDVTPPGKATKGMFGLIRALKKADNAIDIAKAMKSVGFADEVIEIYKDTFVPLKKTKEIKEALDAAVKLQSQTMGRGYRPVAELAKPEVTPKITKAAPKAAEVGISPELQPLAQEARKYKTAEEFVNSQIKAFHGSPLKGLEEIGFGEGIRSQTFLGTTRKVKSGAIFFSPDAKTAKFFADNRVEFLKDLGKKGEPVVYERFLNIKKPADLTSIPKAEKILDDLGISVEKEILGTVPDYGLGISLEDAIKGGHMEINQLWKLFDDTGIVNKFKDAGFDGVLLKETGERGTSYAIFNPKQAFTKSQLTDFYKQAVRGIKEVAPEVAPKVAEKAPPIEDLTKIKQAREARFLREAEAAIETLELQKEREFLAKLGAEIERKVAGRARKDAIFKLRSTIEKLQLRKWENMAEVLSMPKSMSKMNMEQVEELNRVLAQYRVGDEFLPVRMMETLPKTRLAEAKTVREVLEVLAKEKGLTVGQVAKIKPTEFHRYMGDHMLARQHPFFSEIVRVKNEKFLQAEARIIELTDEADTLIKAARKSRPRGVLERAIPTDENIVRWLEADAPTRARLAKEMTVEEVAAAHYMDNTFREYYEWLVKRNADRKFSRFEDQYFPHIRRSFLEAWKEDGFFSAFKEMWQKYEQEQQYLNILDEKTGEILPYEKWIGFAQYRTDNLIPTANTAKAFEAYVTVLEKARHLDEMVPEMMAYVHALSPRRLSPRGIELDDSLKRFVKEWVNANKGRRPRGFFRPGGSLDWGLRSSVLLTHYIDLGFNFTTQIAAPIGEQAMNLTMLKPKAYSTALARRVTPQGRAILKTYENFVGRSFFKEFNRASKTAGDRLTEGMFAIFSGAVRKGNEIFLLGRMTDEEFRTGKISIQRLAELRVEMNKYRAVRGAESIMGQTAEGIAATQYKSWAIPPVRATITNSLDLARMIKAQGIRALASDEGKELFYSIGLGTAIAVFGYGYYRELQEKGAAKRTFMEDIVYKAMRDAMTILGAFDPTMWSGVRVADFYEDLAKALYDLATLQEYKETGELKAPAELQRTLEPRILKQLFPEEETKKPSAKGKSMNTIFKELGLPPLVEPAKLPALPKLPVLTP